MGSADPYGVTDMAQAMRDGSWDEDIRRHVVRAIAEREKHFFAANMVGWAFCALVCQALPYSTAFILPLILRMAAMLTMHVAGRRLRAKLDAREDSRRELRLFHLCLALKGLSWGYLLWPILQSATFHIAAMALVAIMLISVSTIASSTGAIPKMLASFLGPFIGMILFGLLLKLGSLALPTILWALVALFGTILGITFYALGMAREQVALAETMVENRRLSEELTSALSHAEFLLQRDPLTGLYNRRAFFDHQIPPCEHPDSRFLLAIDLDHFKQVNDSFGHETGDRVLIATADAMRDITYDLPGGPHCAVRLGGEEFVLGLCGVDRATAMAAAEALRGRIARIVKELAIPDLETSASIGMTEFKEGEALETALHRADLAMYRAKRNGRNRVILEAA